MMELFFHFVLILVLTSVLAALVVTAPARIGAKVLALALTAGLFGSAYLAGSMLLGRPRPARLALLERTSQEASIVAALGVEGEAIYLWLTLPDETAPRAYQMPWSAKIAEAIRRAQAEAESNGTQARMRNPFRGEMADAEQQYYAPPPPPMPPKLEN
jgi:hypothetical protein